MTILKDKLMTRTCSDKGQAGDYDFPNVLSPWDLVFRADFNIKHKLDRHQVGSSKQIMKGAKQCAVSTDLLV